MARINTVGLNDAIQNINLLDESVRPRIERAVIQAGNIVASATRAEALMYGLHDTGQMVDSIAPAKPEIHSDSVSIDIFPQGVRRNKVRNAVVGFVQHYGRGYGKRKRSGIPFFDTAANLSSDAAQNRMREVFFDEQ